MALRKLRELLSKEGFSIMTVTDRNTAYNICSKLKIDYILANLNDLKFGELDFINKTK